MKYFVLALGLVASPAFASPCAQGLLSDPLAIGFRDGALSVPRRACLRSELAFGADGILIAQPAEFYGNIRALALLSGSWLMSEDLELFGSLELVRYQLVISSLSADHFGVGHTSLGAAYRVAASADSTLAVSLRATLPTAFGLYEHAWPLAFDAGASASTSFDADFELHAYLGLLGSFAFSSAGSDPRFGAILSAGAAYRVFTPFAVILDVEGASFYRTTLDHLALGLGLRVEPTDHFALELLAKAPLAGDERSLLACYLGARWAP